MATFTKLESPKTKPTTAIAIRGKAAENYPRKIAKLENLSSAGKKHKFCKIIPFVKTSLFLNYFLQIELKSR